MYGIEVKIQDGIITKDEIRRSRVQKEGRKIEANRKIAS